MFWKLLKLLQKLNKTDYFPSILETITVSRLYIFNQVVFHDEALSLDYWQL